MRTSEVEFSFPVIGFSRNNDVWGFEDRNTLTSCGPATLKEDLQRDMELVDAKGRRWRVLSITRTGRGEPLLNWLISAVLSTRQSRIEQELEPLEPLTLAEIKARVRAAVEAHEDYYCEPDQREEELEPRLAQLMAARTFQQVYDVFGLDSFMAY